MSFFPRDPEIKGLERALKRLQPSGTVERDEIMYYAGQAAAPRPGWFWQGAAALMTATTVVLAIRLLLQPTMPAAVEKVATVQQPTADAVVPAKDELPVPPATGEPVPEEPANAGPTHHVTECYQMQKQAVRWGVDNLPTPTPVAGSEGAPQTLRSMMNTLTKNP
jgi:hypothetical protein